MLQTYKILDKKDDVDYHTGLLKLMMYVGLTHASIENRH